MSGVSWLNMACDWPGSVLEPSALSPGDSFLVWNAETVLVGEYSERIALVPIVGSANKGVRVVID